MKGGRVVDCDGFEDACFPYSGRRQSQAGSFASARIESPWRLRVCFGHHKLATHPTTTPADKRTSPYRLQCFLLQDKYILVSLRRMMAKFISYIPIQIQYTLGLWWLHSQALLMWRIELSGRHPANNTFERPDHVSLRRSPCQHNENVSKGNV